MPKTRAPHTVPTFEAFAEQLRREPAWAHVHINDHAERFISAQYRDGSLWHWDRNSGFTEVKA